MPLPRSMNPLGPHCEHVHTPAPSPKCVVNVLLTNINGTGNSAIIVSRESAESVARSLKDQGNTFDEARVLTDSQLMKAIEDITMQVSR